MNNSIPRDMLERFGDLPDHKYCGGDEHSSSCPKCGGARGGSDPSDRFRFWERQGASNFWCRRCGFQGFADDDKAGEPDTARLLELEEIREQRAQQENERLRVMIADLQRQAYWKGYHDGMNEAQRGLWREAGVPDSLQDYWQLGFMQNYQGTAENGRFESPAMTIPYFGENWQATTIQYRLTAPPSPTDKYRFQAGLKSALWLADPDSKIKNAVLLCEGMKKAAVTFLHTVASGKGNFVVVAVPSKMPGKDLLSQLNEADPLYICLDPDACTPTRLPGGKIMKSAASRIAQLVTAPKRVVKLPCKSDDFFAIYGGTADDFMGYLNLARTV